MLTITKDQAERIAYAWLVKQENALSLYGGYPGSLYVVRDMLVSFINSNGEKYDGPSVDILTVDQAINDAEQWLEDEEDEDWRQYEAAFGESVQAIAKYLMTAEGGPDEYSPGCPYKGEDSPAVKAFMQHCNT